MIEFTSWQVDHVILVGDLGKEISEGIQDITIKEWQSSLTILKLSLERLHMRTVRVQRPDMVLSSGKNLNSASRTGVYVGKSLWYIGSHLKSSNGIHAHSVNLSNSFSAKVDMLIMSDRVDFLNINSLNMILFSQLKRFGKLAFFEFRPSFLSLDAFRRTGCIGCKLIFLADARVCIEP